MNKISKVLMLVIIYMCVFSSVCFASFDDIECHWAEKEISEFEDRNFLQGYPDGSFKPDQAITKAEFCKIINSYMNYEVDGEWQVSNMKVAKEKGYLAVDENTVAGDYITREEAFVALYRLMKLEIVEFEIGFEDLDDIAIWSLPAIEALTEGGYIKGFPNNELRPKQNLKRAELVAILYKYIGMGGIDTEEPQFAVGYMLNNEYGLEFCEIYDEIELEIGDTLMLAVTVAQGDGDAEVELISKNGVIELDDEFMTIEALKRGTAKLKITTMTSQKNKKVKVIVK